MSVYSHPCFEAQAGEARIYPPQSPCFHVLPLCRKRKFDRRTHRWLDGGKTYRLRVPPDAPVAQFWSFTVYNNETRCFVDTGTNPDRSSRDNIVKNDDGSVDLYFGPEAPAGKPESNWIKTIPGKGWLTYFRLYGPTQAYFDRSWVLPDIERID